ncbi:MAG: GLUG motif-containing protein, partial [Balneolaceae bacterium]
FASGNVSGAAESSAGGLVGKNFEDGNIDQSYSVGQVINREDYPGGGGIVGINHGEIEGSYWDIESSGKTVGIYEGDSTGTEGLTTDQMTGNNAEANMDKFDFVNIWRTTSSYPILWWEED